jgi:hypothetical protein
MTLKNKLFVPIGAFALLLLVIIPVLPNSARASEPTPIADCDDLQDITSDLAGDYVLIGDVDCSAVADFTPLGDFTGTLDGAGFAIEHLTFQNHGLNQNDRAMFSHLIGATVKNLAFTDAVIESNFEGGALAATASDSMIINVSVEGQLNSTAALSFLGAIVGSMDNSIMYYSSADVTITGYQFVGGLVGSITGGSTIGRSYSTGSIIANLPVLETNSYVGGLVGAINQSSIADSYSQMDVTAQGDLVGGLVGRTENASNLARSYSTGIVTSPGSGVGGLVGSDDGGGTLDTNNYWDKDHSTKLASALGTGKTTLEMQTQSTFNTWDFSDIWSISAGQYPTLIGAPTLTEVQAIGSRTTKANAVYHFSANRSGDYLMTSCGAGDQVVDEDAGTVTFSDLQTGHTYSCNLLFEDDLDIESLPLHIGPFTVRSSSTVVGGSSRRPVVSTVLPGNGTVPSISYQAPSSGAGSPLARLNLTRNLQLGSSGEDVKGLQQYLNSLGFVIALSGPGSVGAETIFFGTLTRAAVSLYQKSRGIVPAVGFVGPLTRASINSGK